ncbi:zinc finger protein 319-like [Anopheles cruzii]|uniref:zinc finger protein 319-like n=1 Tax=Anopheles cruzii TaxID=68878 RepID=UPI0022EC87AE|nr:zinc finger protein 319-like [Anopheles cruzii]
MAQQDGSLKPTSSMVAETPSPEATGEHQPQQSTITTSQDDPATTARCDKNGTKDGPLRKCLMCLLPFDELGSIGSESPEELKRIVDNIYKIAKIEVKPADGKIEPLCGSCRAKLGYDYDEDAYYEMLSQMYSSEVQSKMITIAMSNGLPVHIAMPAELPELPTSGAGVTGPYIDAACGTFVVTELGVEALNADKDELVCAICSKAFNFKSTLRLHIRSHHQSAPRETVELPRQSRKPRAYECVECQLSFKLKYDFDKHIAIHKKTNLFQCEVCFKLFKHKSYYSMHRNMKRCKVAPVPLDLTTLGSATAATVSSPERPPVTTNGGRRNGKTKDRSVAAKGAVSTLLQCSAPDTLATVGDCGVRNAS